ncbi:SDR family NAD(P)-dependent oxidoreductase [Emticicia sp. C21]|uniref:SDR family NAD(P)-dependent oxidoreductase n=1 Tax=Emticicia sp. C21 TaxID=2302915 RepID=UPI000E35192C|nr:SDR family NAD(P)-dependent oxidoreductase [Emticicia sp. C21]RFS15661.1 SDR family NAD(P)-dependent oxidoreductase [Emticicia sp. C21]
MDNSKKVWFVTGASKGLGLALVKKLLTEGYRVAATSRDVKSLSLAVDNNTSNFLPLQVELLNEESVLKAIQDVINTFGGIDVLVNNAGYGQIGTLEEMTDVEARENFDINIFGLLNVTRNMMSHFRTKKSGHIINVSSIAGLLGTFPGWGVYCATKFAVVGLTEALSAEAKEFNVKATIVYPGYFNTNFLKEGSMKMPANPIADYTAARNTEVWHETQMIGNQPGDPDKAALAFIQLAEMENAPLHFFMGSDSFGMAYNKIEVLQNELTANEVLSKSTDYKK